MKSIQSYPNQEIFDRILNIHGIVGKNYNYRGYEDLHFLYRLNKIFSDKPYGEIIDRTGNTKYPFQVHVRLPWTIPTKELSLEQVCENRVCEIAATNPKHYYVYWSGGIDSTLALVSILKVIEHDKITVVMSNRSITEYPEFYEQHINGKLTVLQLHDQIPINHGVHITGDPADTIWAILDDSFMGGAAANYLHAPYEDYFRIRGADDEFLAKTAIFNSHSGHEIKTLFEARWWYYLNCKSQSKSVSIITRFNTAENFCPFYESRDFDNWSYYNTDRMIIGSDWKTYKFPAKDIIYKFDKNIGYHQDKTKEYSNDPVQFVNKTPHNFRDIPLFITDDFRKPVLSSGIFFSKNIYRQELYDTYAELFKPT